MGGKDQSAAPNHENHTTPSSPADRGPKRRLIAWTQEDEPTEEEEDKRIAEARARARIMSFDTRGRRQQLYDERADTLLPTADAANLLPGNDFGSIENQKVLDEAMRPGSGVVNDPVDPKMTNWRLHLNR